MKGIFVFIGTGMAGFLDLTLGALISALIHQAFSVEVTIPALILGAALGVLPDIDLLVSGMGRGRPLDHRVFLTHRPLVILPVVAGMGYLFGGMLWSVIAFTCVLWHYLHDTSLLSGGHINWVWPFGKDQPSSSERDWIQNTWLVPTSRAVLEIAVGALAGAFALSLAGYRELAAALALAAALGAVLIWNLWPRVKMTSYE